MVLFWWEFDLRDNDLLLNGFVNDGDADDDDEDDVVFISVTGGDGGVGDFDADCIANIDEIDGDINGDDDFDVKPE